MFVLGKPALMLALRTGEGSTHANIRIEVRGRVKGTYRQLGRHQRTGTVALCLARARHWQLRGPAGPMWCRWHGQVVGACCVTVMICLRVERPSCVSACSSRTSCARPACWTIEESRLTGSPGEWLTKPEDGPVDERLQPPRAKACDGLSSAPRVTCSYGSLVRSPANNTLTHMAAHPTAPVRAIAPPDRRHIPQPSATAK